LGTGERYNLTQSPGRVDREPQWWPSQPDVIVFGSMDDVGPSAGFPTIVKTDASEYQVLDEEVAGPFALSPDGQTIAYGCCGNQGRLYRWGQGGEIFDPALYGASIDKLYTPSWSPDGRYLAWVVGGNLTGDGRWQIGLAVFDLEAKTHQILHPYEPLGGAMVSFN
jgi:Tol biopolymer transport system component